MSKMNNLEMLRHKIQDQLNRIQLRCVELDTMVEVCRVEIVRLQQDHVALQEELRRATVPFDPPHENFKRLRGIYESLLETRTRLVTVQCQFEKYTKERADLDTFREILVQIGSLATNATPRA